MRKSMFLPLAAACVLLPDLAVRADYPAVILADHPAAYYRLEETNTASNVALDSSGNSINGNYNYDFGTNTANVAATYPLLGQPGIGTNSALFHVYTDTNASVHSATVEVPYNPSLNPQGPFAVEFWARPTSDNGGDYAIPVGNFGGYGNDSGWHFYQSPGRLNPPSGSWVWNVRSCGAFIQTSPVVKNAWTHLVGVYDGTNLIFYINGSATATVSGAGYLANGANDLFIGGNVVTGHDFWEGYVDEVALYTNALSAAQVMTHYTNGLTQFAARFSPPVFLADPASITNTAGSTTVFDPIVTGATPFSYQWFRGASPILNATNSVYSFTDSISDNGATFHVVVSNSYSSVTSAVANLEVHGALFINSTPGSITRNVGSYAAFHVTASGAGPISYQWSKSTDGINFTSLLNQTGPTLWLTNVQMADSGSYYAVAVHNPFVSTNVAPAILSVQPRAVTVPLTGYGGIIAADKPVAFWRLDEADGALTAVDAVGSFDGTYTAASGVITYGVATGIPHTTDPAVTFGPAGPASTIGPTVQIPFAPELNPEITWSVEMWLNPSSLGANGGDYRVVLASEYNLYPNPYNGWYIYQQPSADFAFVPQPGNAFITAGPNDPAHANKLVAGSWYHLVVTDDGTLFHVYINGEARTSFPVASSGFIPNGDGVNGDGSGGVTPGFGNSVIGQRTDAAFNTFLGTVDDTAFYNYALSAGQVQAHYLATVKLNIATSGSNAVLSWPFGALQSATNVTGTYTNVPSATSPYTTPESGTRKFFRVQVQ